MTNERTAFKNNFKHRQHSPYHGFKYWLNTMQRWSNFNHFISSMWQKYSDRISCFLQGSHARFPAHVYLTLDTSSGVYMRCSWFLMCHITIHEPHQIHERSIGLIQILHQNRRVLQMASLRSLNWIYFENHPGAHLHNRHSKPFMTDTAPQKGYRLLGEIKETRIS